MKAQLCLADDGPFLATGTQVKLVPPQRKPSWSVVSRIAFRFCLVYFGLFCLLTQIFGGLVPIANLGISNFWPTRQIVTWTAVHIFGITHPLVYMGGSGDKVFDWVLVFCLLVIAAVATVCLVHPRPKPAELCRAVQMVSSGRSLRLGLTDVVVRDGKSCSSANALSTSHPATRTIRQLLTYGRSLVLGGRVSRL